MASIRPFTGLRYSSSAGDLSRLIAPPYDVISAEYRKELGDRDPHNYVHLTLPESDPNDRSQFVKYAKSAALLAEWRRDGVLAKESAPAFYRYRQTFTIPGGGDKTYHRTALMALLKVEPYENGVVLPHEKTFPKHKADRLHLLEATRAHLESIFGLYEDPAGTLLKLVESAPAGEQVTAKIDDGVLQSLEPITDAAAVEAIVMEFADKRVWIADGHHRYETALGFRQSLGEKPGPVAEDYLVISLTAMNDPGLVLLPTHRTVPSLSMSSDEIKAKLGACFQLTACDPNQLMSKIAESEKGGKQALGLVLLGEGWLLTVQDHAKVNELLGEEGSSELKALDVSLLHRVALGGLLGLTSPEQVGYTRSESEAIELVQSGKAVASFLMEPPSVDDMRTLALLGEKMPQKSTYYYPKIMSGLAAWSLNDFI